MREILKGLIYFKNYSYLDTLLYCMVRQKCLSRDNLRHCKIWLIAMFHHHMSENNHLVVAIGSKLKNKFFITLVVV